MTKIKPGDWVACKIGDTPIKLPTDQRTLIRVYRAAMRWSNATERGDLYDAGVCKTALARVCLKAQKAKRVR